jgi:hypothetical protein
LRSPKDGASTVPKNVCFWKVVLRFSTAAHAWEKRTFIKFRNFVKSQ